MNDEDDDRYREENHKDLARARLSGVEGMPIFAGFMMAAISSGKSAKGAANEAELAMVELRKRYT